MLSISSSKRSIRYGQRAAHRKEIDQAAAHAELAGRNDLRHMLVAGERELRAQRRHIEPRPLLQEERERREIRRRREPVQCRRRRDHEHVALAARDAIERCEPLGDEVVVRREVIVGQRLPVGQERDPQARRKPRNLVGEPMRRERVAADDGQQALLLRALQRELRERERVRRAGEWFGARLATRQRAAAARARAARRASKWSLRCRESRARRRSNRARWCRHATEPPQPPPRWRVETRARATANRAPIIRGARERAARSAGPKGASASDRDAPTIPHIVIGPRRRGARSRRDNRKALSRSGAASSIRGVAIAIPPISVR